MKVEHLLCRALLLLALASCVSCGKDGAVAPDAGTDARPASPALTAALDPSAGTVTVTLGAEPVYVKAR